MSEMQKLGSQLQRALIVGVPAELVAMIATTSHPGRLQALFHKSSLQLIAAHRSVLEREAQQRPSVVSAQQLRERMKALVDLVRARAQALGTRKPSVDAMLKLMDRPVTELAAVPAKVVPMRRIA
jgi:hypothetical protein